MVAPAAGAVVLVRFPFSDLSQTVDEVAESAWEMEITTRLKELDKEKVRLVS